jgi:ABC-type dipeptide/oligopeptide/nickel transport system ATPase subunit
MGDAAGVNVITSTLADALIKRGHAEDYARANQIPQEQINAAHPTMNMVMALHQRGRVLTHLGPGVWSEAEDVLRRGLDLAPPNDLATLNGIRLSLSQLAEVRGDIAGAITEMEKKRALDIEQDRADRVALDDTRIARLRRKLSGGD